MTDSESVPVLCNPDGNTIVDNADAQWTLNFFAYMPLTLPLAKGEMACHAVATRRREGVISTNPMDPERNGIIDNADEQQTLAFFANVIPLLPVERSEVGQPSRLSQE